MAYRVTFAGRPDGATANIRTGLFSPVRAEIKFDTTAYTGKTKVLPTNGKPIATPRAVYLNRNANNSDMRKASVDGWYYIVASLGVAYGDAPAGGVPVTIDVAVAGDKVAGPQYGASTGETPTETPSATPTEPTPSTSTTAEVPPQTPPTDDSSSSNLPWIITGAAVLVALATLLTALLRRRTKQVAPPAYPQNPGYPQPPAGPNNQPPYGRP